MALMKITGVPVTVEEKDHRLSVDPPQIQVRRPADATWKVYAAQLLALTALTDANLVAKIRKAAEQITTGDDENWTQDDARKVLDAVGVPPAPSHVLVERVPGHGMVLVRAVGPETKKARKVRYNKKRPGMTLLRELRAEGMVVAVGTCMEVPVKLVETETGLAVALFLRRQKTRDLAETEE